MRTTTKSTGNSDAHVVAAISYATELAARGGVEAAVQHLLTVLEQVPTAASLNGYAAIFLSRIGRLEEAIQHGQQATRLSPKSEKASFVLFHALSMAERYIEALEEVKRFMALSHSEEYSALALQLEKVCSSSP